MTKFKVGFQSWLLPVVRDSFISVPPDTSFARYSSISVYLLDSVPCLLFKIVIILQFHLGVYFPLHLPQQKATVTTFLRPLPLNGQLLLTVSGSLLSDFTFTRVPFRSLATFLAQLPQQTPIPIVWSASTTLLLTGHFSFIGTAFFAAKAPKQRMAEIAIERSFLMTIIF